jgi:hypothetical protein
MSSLQWMKDSESAPRSQMQIGALATIGDRLLRHIIRGAFGHVVDPAMFPAQIPK